MSEVESNGPEPIAVVGMAGRFPGAPDPDALWRVLIDGVDAVEKFKPEDLEYSCATPEDLAAGRKFVTARGTLPDVDLFDAGFFGIYPKEAELMDPQHRLFLECAWEALESAGHDPARYPGLIGVYAGVSLNTYLLWNLGIGRRLAGNYQVGEYQTMLGNDKDFLPVRVSYKFNLRGPSMGVQCACSTSLVAICQAASALSAYQCDMALAGGVSITFPQRRDYPFEPDAMVSADGKCRAFDADANGTIFGHGCAVVLLKRLSDALADRNPIHALIRGWAVNNDGSDKVGFAAPSVRAQADVIMLAQAMAGVHPDEVSYIEAHGTGTPLGDPIEVAALNDAFRTGGATASGSCALGTAKTNIGHLDVAAGAAGVIKTILQFRHERIPPLLHYTKPNPRIDFANSPFTPVAQPLPWLRGQRPRIAGVSAFGVGGTNAHVVLQEPPARAPSPPARAREALLLSARSATALDAMTRRLADHLAERPDLSISDVAYTLAVGRKRLPFRRAVVAHDAEDAVERLRASIADAPVQLAPHAREPRIVFLFPGQGAQYIGMGAALYREDASFREAIDECAEGLRAHLGLDLRDTLFPRDTDRAAAEQRINETWLTQPAIFAVEYACARLWMARGVRPSVLIGHSIGEYVAAVLSGTFTPADALRLIALRAKLMMELPAGAMLAVRMSAEDVAPLLPEGVSIAAVNSPKLCTVSGPTDAVERLRAELESKGILAKRLPTSHAFHSSMMEPMLAPFAEAAAQIVARAPGIDWISTCTGAPMDEATLSDPAYWARQIRQPVLFSRALEHAFAQPGALLLEVGPGQALAQFARQHPARPAAVGVVASLPKPEPGDGALDDIERAWGQLWTYGVEAEWETYFGPRQRVELPTYPFERQRYWIDNSRAAIEDEPAALKSAEPPPESAGAADDSATGLLREIIDILADLSGMPPDAIDPKRTFIDLGFDSLFLTQASQAVQKKYLVKITLRQLLDTLPTPAAIAAHVAANRPASSISAPQSKPEALPAAAAASPFGMEDTAPAKPPARHGPFAPINTSAGESLTPRQRRALDALISRYVAKTRKSKEYTQQHRPHFSDPRAVSGFRTTWKEIVYPIVSARSAGSRIWDIDGNEYIDVTMGFGTYLFGHNPDFIRAALERQLATGIEIGPQSALAGGIAKTICEISGMDRATFCTTGSEAVMGAVRAARTVTGRGGLVYFSGDYHGIHEEVLAKGVGAPGQWRTLPIAPGIPRELVSQVHVLPWGDPAALDWIRANAATLAAVLVEPVQSRRPEMQPRDFLHAVRAITRESGVALIFDEIVTGFRLDLRGAQAFYGIEADLVTYGKIVGGGIPIGVIAGKRAYLDAFDGGVWQYGDDSVPEAGVTFFAGTFVRHPLAMAAARAVLDHLLREGSALQHALTNRTARFVDSVNAFFTAQQVDLTIRTCGSIWYLAHGERFPYFSLLFPYLRERGLHVWEGRPCFMSTAHDDADIARIEEAIRGAVRAMREDGFIPERIEVFPASGPFPLTEAQREIWLTTRLEPSAAASFNESCAFTFRGPLDRAALDAALQRLIERHEALRTTFDSEGAQQTVHPGARADVRFDDLAGWPEDARRQRLEAAIHEEVSRPFDLAQAPLLRARLVRLATDHHVLSLTVHHLICDGYSYDVMARDLAALYTALAAGEADTRPMPTPFREYARRMAEYRRDPRHDADRAYWLAALADPPAAIEWPLDRPRPAVRTFAGLMEVAPIETDLLDAIKRLGARNKSTLFATLLAVYAALIHRLTGRREFIVGIPAAGQQWAETTDLVGHCANLLPLRFRVDPDRPFADLLDQARRLLLDAYEHQALSFGEILQSLSLPRDPSRPPLIQATFNVDPAMYGIRFGALDAEIVINPRTGYQFEHSLNIVAYEDRLRMECNFNSDLFEVATIRRWLRHYAELARAAAADEQTPMDFLPLMDDSERHMITVGWNPAPTPYPSACIHELFEEVAAAQPDRVALVFEGRELSYGDLNARANRIARALLKSGVRPEQPVALCADRSFDEIVGLLAILKAGGAYLPLDPTHPAERLRALTADAGAQITLAQAAHRALAENSAKRVIMLEDDPAWRGESDANPTPEERGALHHSKQLAYVMFTSGSTGRPKGVLVEHRSVVKLVRNVRYVRLGSDERMIHLAPLAFDASTFEIWGALLNGARLAILPSGPFSMAALTELIRRERATILWITTGLFHTLVDEGAEGLDSIRQVLTGGEVTSGRHIRRLLDRYPDLTVIHCYGPTECTTFTTAEPLRRGEPFGDPPPLGRAIENTRVYVLDERMQPCPIGVPGELCVGGDGVARGYLNQPEATAQVFVPHPLAGEGARLYRSGDLARWRADGKLEFLGRRDEQVKIRGFRIEPGEVEAALAKHPGVQTCVVVARPAPNGDKQLIAYVAPSASGAPDAETLREHLGSQLPAFMIPARFVIRSDLPFTAGGKVDRRALPAPDEADAPRLMPVAPSGGREALVAAAYRELLSVQQVGSSDDFFALGGHSLLALKLINRLRDAGYALEVASLFRDATVRGVAEALSSLEGAPPRMSSDGVVVQLREGRMGRPPLILAPSDFGDLLIYANVLPHLGSDLPVIGLQCADFYENNHGIDSMQKLAKWFVDHVRAFQPHGPYMLSGYCFGGHVALEMARLLKADGEAVSFLGLIDARPFRPASFRGEYLLMRLQGAYRAKLSDWKRHLSAKMAMRREAQLIDRIARTNPDRLGRRELNSWTLEQRLLMNYRTTVYPGTITFFYPEESQYALYGDPTCGWLHLAERVRLIKVPGSHVNMMKEPHAAELAKRLMECLSCIER